MSVFSWGLSPFQINHRLRWAGQVVSRPQIGVVGGYHHGNLGDMALGHAVKFLLEAHSALRGQRIGLQTLYSLQRWRKPGFVVVGGGAVITSATIRQIRAHVGNDPARVAFLGIDLLDRNLDLDALAFLASSAQLVFRSTEERDLIRSQRIENAGAMPDLVFGYAPHLTQIAGSKETEGQFGVNIVPKLLGKSISSAEPGGGTAHGRYLALLRAMVQKHQRAGFSVSHIPFTPLDDAAARKALTGLDVTFLPYSDNPDVTFARVRGCGVFLPSRFYALIFAMIGHTPCIPFLYSGKCKRLLSDFFPGETATSAAELEQADGFDLDAILAQAPRVFEPATVDRLSALVKVAVDHTATVIDQAMRL